MDWHTATGTNQRRWHGGGPVNSHNPRRIATEVYSQAVSIRRELHKATQQSEHQLLDSYYIEFPSLCESYVLPKKKGDEPVVNQKLNASAPAGGDSAPGSTPAAGKLSAKAPCQTPLTMRQLIHSPVAAENRTAANLRQHKRQSFPAQHRPKTIHPASFTAKDNGSLPGNGQLLNQAITAADERKRVLPGRTTCKPWKEVADCGSTRSYIAYLSDVSRQRRIDEAQKLLHDQVGSSKNDCFGDEGTSSTDYHLQDFIFPTKLPLGGGNGASGTASSDLLSVSQTQNSTINSHAHQRKKCVSPCSCHLTWYTRPCGSMRNEDAVKSYCDEENETLDYEMLKSLADAQHDLQRFCASSADAQNDTQLYTEPSSHLDSTPIVTNEVEPESSSTFGFHVGREGIWSDSSSLMKHFVCPAPSEGLAVALLEGCCASSTEDSRRMPKHALVVCDHAWRHYELSLESECGGYARSSASNAAGDHCFDWNCYEEQPLILAAAPAVDGSGLSTHQDMDCSCRHSPDAQANPHNCCRLCGYNSDTGPLQTPSADALGQLVLPYLIQLGTGRSRHGSAIARVTP